MYTRIPDEVLWSARGPHWHIPMRWELLSGANDWRPSSAAICIAALRGKRCRRSRPTGIGCLCEEVTRRFGSRIDDHARRWIAADGSPVITYEPYAAADDPVIGEFRAFCAERRLTVEIGDRSPWCPGETVLLIVRAARR